MRQSTGNLIDRQAGEVTSCQIHCENEAIFSSSQSEFPLSERNLMMVFSLSRKSIMSFTSMPSDSRPVNSFSGISAASCCMLSPFSVNATITFRSSSSDLCLVTIPRFIIRLSRGVKVLVLRINLDDISFTDKGPCSQRTINTRY